MAVKAHPFMPKGWQNPKFLLWLRRTHGWVGLFGAAFGILYSLTTLFMEHNNFGLPDEDTIAKTEISIPVTARTDLDAFIAYAQDTVGAKNDWRPLNRRDDKAKLLETGDYSIRFVSPAAQIEVRYMQGEDMAEVSKIDRTLAKTVNRLHRAEGVTMTWKLIADAFTFSLLFLAITGIMMWAKNHGSRWLAIGLFAISTGVIFYTASVGA